LIKTRKLAIFLLRVSILTKSAQIPFRAWLPQAIAAPTPVSSLVHSSTLVTAGVYLGYRNFLIVNIKILIYTRRITLILSSFMAIIEKDFKRVIALSTIRQISMMFLIFRTINYILSFIHIITHAMFKRMLFLSRGNFLHSFNSIQDLRSIKGRIRSKKIRSIYLITRSSSLIGFPFIAGFYSKDFIYENRFYSCKFLIILIVFIRIIITSFYTIKIVKSIFGPLTLSISSLKEGKLTVIAILILFF
jgi:NADH-ubiquinone oxidoreductase chain 5